jgi:hypothetical protein
LFTENRFSQFSPIHELGEIQRQTLNLMALRHGNAEEKKRFWEEQREQQEEERLDLGQRQSPWACSYCQVGGRDGV